MADFKKLRVWQEARKLTKSVFGVANDIRGPCGYILRDQVLRATLSITANVAEGSAKRSDREFARFVKIALGSVAELESHLIIAVDVEALREPDCTLLTKKLVEISGMLNRLLDRLVAAADRAKTKPPRIPHTV